MKSQTERFKSIYDENIPTNFLFFNCFIETHVTILPVKNNEVNII